MKNIYVFTGFFFLSFGLFSQNKDTKEADKLFDRLEFVEAAKTYTLLVSNDKADGYVLKQLADCNYAIFNTKEAVKWYAKATETKQDAETYFRYAQMLKAEGYANAADVQMEQFAKLKPNDARAKAFLNNPNYLTDLKKIKKQFDVSKIDINSDKTDFGAVLTNDNEVYFTSARNTANKTFGMNEEPYLDLYKTIRNSDGKLSEAVAVTELNTKWHDGTATISADGTSIYYGSESFNENVYEKNKQKHLKLSQIYLFKATKSEGDKWINSKPLPFNSKEYSVRNPSISKDGKTLYFSSNMPGGFGGEDLWKVTVDGDNFGAPENLGATINTEANESFPFIQDDNVLFFSSNGRQGFGGYDVFKYNTITKEKPENIGEPINSQKDDFAFSYNIQKNVGYFSSNRTGNDDIYQSVALCSVEAILLIKDAVTGNVIADAVVNLVANKSAGNTNQISNALGETTFDLPCDELASFLVKRNGYEDGTATMEKSKNGIHKVTLFLQPSKPIITEREVLLEPIFFEYNKSNITAQGAAELDKLVAVMNEYPTMVIDAKSHTDSRGNDQYNMKLSDDRAKSTVQYIISKGISADRITGNGMGETQPKINCTDCTDDEHAQNRRSEFLIVRK